MRKHVYIFSDFNFFFFLSNVGGRYRQYMISDDFSLCLSSRLFSAKNKFNFVTIFHIQ